MVKWFCDICTLEILAPEHPIRISSYQTAKNRSDIDSGWGECDDIFKVFCHQKCADVLEGELKGAVESAKRVVTNNA